MPGKTEIKISPKISHAQKPFFQATPSIHLIPKAWSEHGVEALLTGEKNIINARFRLWELGVYQKDRPKRIDVFKVVDFLLL